MLVGICGVGWGKDIVALAVAVLVGHEVSGTGVKYMIDIVLRRSTVAVCPIACSVARVVAMRQTVGAAAAGRCR